MPSYNVPTGHSFTRVITMETEVCCNCGLPFAMPSDFRSQLLNDPNHWFYCPNGHRQHYSESREARLRREAEKKLQQRENELIQEQTAKIQLENELKKAQKKLKRVQNGVCPCCNRTFQDLAKHMAHKHPEVKIKK